jgi:N terminal of Calcineurin-like phosphoesterase
MGAKRWGMIRAGLAVFASVVWLGASLVAAQNVTGVVFHDANGNSIRESGEAGIPGVLVTNGIDVVQTDGTGRYLLPVTDETIIAIVKPAGYKVPVDKDMLPQFYYIHQPNGTPPQLNLGYPGIDPTGPLPASVDLALMPADESDQFKAMMIADPQPQTSAEVDYIRDDFVAQVIGTDAVFGKTHGDIMFDDLSLFPRYNAVIGQIGIPWWNVPGNHEINFPSPNDHYSAETFKRYYGPT